MKVKIVARLIGFPEIAAVKMLEPPSLLAASRFHGDFWNASFAWTDQFRSTMYIFDELARRWLKAETIN